MIRGLDQSCATLLFAACLKVPSFEFWKKETRTMAHVEQIF
jgi:hypothetical protein